MHTQSPLRALCALFLGILAVPAAHAVSQHYLTQSATSTITVYQSGNATITGTLVQASADTGGLFWPCQIVVTQGGSQVASQSFSQVNASNAGTDNSWTVSLAPGTYTVTWYNSSGTIGGPNAGWNTLDWISTAAPAAVGPPPATPITFTPSPLSFPYDGQPHGPNANATIPGNLPAPAGSYTTSGTPTAINAGGYGVQYDAVAPSYSGTSNPVSWSITPATVSFGISPTSFTYDGAAHAPGISVSGDQNGLTYSASGTTSAVNVGSYSMTVSTTDGNHSGSNTLSWSIAPAGQSVSVAPVSTSITVGQSVVFTASGAKNGYAWGGSASGSGPIKSVTFNTGGTFTVTVSSPAGGNYSASNTATATITVGKLDQTISFAKPANQTYGNTLPISATASSGLPVTLTVSGGPATLNAGTLSFSGVGDVTVTASQAGNATYNAAPNVSQTFTVIPKPVTFTLNRTSFPYSGAAQGPIVIPSDSAATFAKGGTLSATNVGGYTATATANGNYTGSNNGLGWAIAPGVQTVYLSPPYATTTSGSPIAYSATGGTGTGAWIWGGTAGPVGSAANVSVAPAVPGSYTITVQRAGDANYAASNQALATLTVVNTPPEATLSASQSTLPYGGNVTLTVGASDPDANLSSLSVDVSSDNATWTSGAANWSGITAWSLTGAAASGTITFTPTASGTWYFRARSADGAGATSGYATTSVNVSAPTPATVKVVPKSPGVVVQDPNNTKHAQVRVP
jgi:hypothetical protein